jgi:hypothetical protein
MRRHRSGRAGTKPASRVVRREPVSVIPRVDVGDPRRRFGPPSGPERDPSPTAERPQESQTEPQSLLACAGGDGGGAASSPVVTDSAPLRPFRVRRVLPSRGSADVVVVLAARRPRVRGAPQSGGTASSLVHNRAILRATHPIPVNDMTRRTGRPSNIERRFPHGTRSDSTSGSGDTTTGIARSRLSSRDHVGLVMRSL